MKQTDSFPLLHAYGLDQAITDEDDPFLWEAVLSRYWPHPSAPDGFHYDPLFVAFSKVSKVESVPIGESVSEGHQTVFDNKNASTINVSGLCFCVSFNSGQYRTRKKKKFLGVFGSGVVKTPIIEHKEWRFDRIDKDQLQIIPADEIELEVIKEVRFHYPKHSLSIRRPTYGVKKTVIYSNFLADPDGGGTTYYTWERDNSGNWHETNAKVGFIRY